MGKVLQIRSATAIVDGEEITYTKGDEIPDEHLGIFADALVWEKPTSDDDTRDAADATAELHNEQADTSPPPAVPGEPKALGDMTDDELAGHVRDATIAVLEEGIGDDLELAARVLAAEEARGDDARSTFVAALRERLDA